MKRQTKNPALKRHGAAVVEMAVVMPIVFVLFYGLIEISRLMLLQHTADAAAYEGARQAIVPGASASEGLEAAKVLLEAVELNDTVVTIDPAMITEDTTVVSVTVKIPTAKNTWLDFFCLDDFTITSEISLYCERPPISLLTGTSAMKLKAKSAKAKAKPVGL